MEKFFCFHCQQDVSPYKILKWRFCPHCRKLITDDGSGFYRVCDECGANMPSDGEYCIKCGHNLQGGADRDSDKDRILAICRRNLWKNGFIAAAFLLFVFLLILGILYISFYFVIFGAVFAVAAAIINSIWRLIK